MSNRTVDVVVIGGGPAGTACAGRLGRAGLTVVLVERELVGGESAYWGGMPSKALLRPSEAIAEALRVPGAREIVRGELDSDAALRRRDTVIDSLDDNSWMAWLAERSVELVRGTASLAGHRRVRVGAETLAAHRAVVVATGTAPALPPVPGLADVDPWTNREATTATTVPGSLIVIGGGAVGVELAQAWTSLGAHVTLRVLAKFLAELLHGELARRAIIALGRLVDRFV